ncbi:MAG: tetratricopeptide repeat protein [Burkholderiales bacterium]|nr:tetratricopeptide repeat protein [Burkholderiales bacterium]
MLLSLRCAVLAFAAIPLFAPAQDGTPPAADPPVLSSAMDSELFYEVLLGELNAGGTDPGAGYSLILDAARKTDDERLYQRAVNIALQARSGDAALQAASAWREARPESRDANRYVLQILIAMNRIAETAEPLKSALSLAGPRDRPDAIAAIPRIYARTTDKQLATRVVEQVLAEDLMRLGTGAAAWTTIGQMRQNAGNAEGAVEAARRAQEINPAAEAPVRLALDLMSPKLPQAEALVLTYLEDKPAPEIRMDYARALLDAQRYAEASEQLRRVTTEWPQFADAWLVQGSLQAQDNKLAEAEKSLYRFLELARPQAPSEARSRAMAQAYVVLSRVAEQRKDFKAAEGWLDRIENPEDLVSAQTRRASLLARQGKIEEARQLIRQLPERKPGDARVKLMAEVQLLRDQQQFQAAYDLLKAATQRDPKDTDLLYDQAMVAEKLGNTDDMEKLLRTVIATRPDHHHAYNALGYSLADRNVRLPEARKLIEKALELSPGDPFIRDSLGWVEFRMGNTATALEILEAAYKSRPDPEIAAHLGEVLWSSGQRDRARAIWKEGQVQNAENETLRETLKRLRVRL